MAAAGAGWCFGFGYFLAGLYWVGYAFLVDAKTFGWLLPIAVAGLPAYLALFTALGLATARLAWVRGPSRVFALAAALTAAEWLRGHVLSGFPWNAFGYALTQPLALAQSVSLTGVWGLTFLVLTICATPALFADDRSRHAASVATAAGGAGGASRVDRIRRGAAVDASDRVRRQGEVAHHAARFAAGPEIQLLGQRPGHGALPRAVRSHDRAAIERRARCHASDLAGIGLSVFPHARAGRAGADRGAVATGQGADHRRRPRCCNAGQRPRRRSL